LSLEGGVEAWSFQQRVEKFNREEILPILEEVFSAFSPPESSVRIDRMVIDLGRISLRNFEKELPETLRQRVFEAVKAQVKRARTVSTQQEGSEGGDLAANEGERSRLLSTEQSGIELLRFFLETGVLPWWADDTVMEELLDHLVETVPDELKPLIEENLDSEPFRKRLAYQFPHALLVKVFRLLKPGEVERVEVWFHDLEKVGGSSHLDLFKTGTWRHMMWDHVFMRLAGQEGTGESQAFFLLRREKDFLAGLREEMRLLEPFLRGEKRSLIEAPIEEEAHEFQHLAVPTAANERVRDQRESVQPLGSVRLESRTSKLASRHEARAQDAERLQVRVENAGLVLLWPFLGEFFKSLGYLEEKGFVDENIRIRAVHVLEYAGTGGEHRAEPFLALNKVLCGLDVTAPILREADLTEQERKKSDELLAAVVSRWAALKRTSIEGFRTAFLQRQGLLTRKEEAWTLQVERKPYDLLLERLPWGISMIRLSWMQEMIQVEW
jgi:hypothetical protein